LHFQYQPFEIGAVPEIDMTRLLALLLGVMVAGLVAHAQGSVNFANIAYSGGVRVVDAPITLDYVTKLAGTGYMAQLWAGTTSNSLAAVGYGTPFLTGAGAGYFQGGALTIPNIAGGATAFLQVRAWDVSTGATWGQANISGESWIFPLVLGSGGTPPAVPTNLVGLRGFAFCLCPEPSTIAFGVLGVAALSLRRRK
jgi:hypothetical protein